MPALDQCAPCSRDTGMESCGMRRTLIIISCLLATSLVTISCAKKPQPGTSSQQDRATIIRRGNGGEPGSLDPALAEDIHAFNILTDLYEGLVAVSSDGRLIPGVAESWQISDDGLVYTFVLRDNARWSNGEPVLASNFVNAFRRIANPANGSAYGFLLESIQNFAEIQSESIPVDRLAVAAVDERRLEIRLTSPTPWFLAALSMPVAFPVNTSTANDIISTTADSFVGNGAYQLKSVVPGGAIGVTRNPTYWDADSVAVEEIIFLPIVDPVAELDMYRSGELDITQTIPPTHVRTLNIDMPEHVRIAPSLALYYLAFDLTEAPLDDRLLRQSLNMAIDRDTLVSLIGRGEQAAFGVVPPGVTNHDGANFAWRDLPADERQAQALQLYRQAGYSEKTPLSLQLTYDAGDIHEKVALAVSSMWRDVLGVDVTIRKMEWQYFLATRENRADWQVMRFAWFGDYDEASTFTNIFRTNDPQNLAAYANPEYDRLVANASAERSDARRSELMKNAEAMLLDDYPIAPLYFYVSKHMVNPGISGFESNALDRHPSKFLSVDRTD